ncbi:molecular chaperone IbpA [Bradyrhizobium sp. LA6.1]
MRTYDFAPLWRSTIGFDRLFDLAETAQRASEDNYPPYNIERLAEDRYQISLAVAGFSPEDIVITGEQNVVTVEGSKSDKTDFLYRGISHRNFKRQFSLAEYVQVKSASPAGLRSAMPRPAACRSWKLRPPPSADAIGAVRRIVRLPSIRQ